MPNLVDLKILGILENSEVAFDARLCGEMAIRPALAPRKILPFLMSKLVGLVPSQELIHHLLLPFHPHFSAVVVLTTNIHLL